MHYALQYAQLIFSKIHNINRAHNNYFSKAKRDFIFVTCAKRIVEQFILSICIKSTKKYKIFLND